MLAESIAEISAMRKNDSGLSRESLASGVDSIRSKKRPTKRNPSPPAREFKEPADVCRAIATSMIDLSLSAEGDCCRSLAISLIDDAGGPRGATKQQRAS